ncbi:MAG: protein kinase [Xanthomonadales bacterium]|nr:protein kinase [Xanthomonadales bacterium]
MAQTEWQRLDQALDRLLQLDAVARERTLAALEQTEPEQARKLRRLLAGLDRSQALEGAAGAELVARALSQWTELQPGKRIGEWTILRRIGAGGMAEVYEAERPLATDAGIAAAPAVTAPPRQRAAIKLMGASVVGTVGREGFLREMAILAQLDDPRLSRLIDAGNLDDGRPWLAMEYVEGQDLLQACDARGLNVRERVRLLIEIAGAVAHAHRQLIIHRDLKPANILLDATGRPRVLDFGIAKLVDPGQIDAERTHSNWRAYTLHHASPEQLTGANTGVASDVYQLGLLLFLLLTGERAFFGRDADPHALLQAMHEGPTLASRQAAQAAIMTARSRGVSPGRLARTLRGDLDSILLHALQYRPDRRYRSADELAADLQRWLDGEPVQVRASSRGYRARRWLRRHWVASSACVLVLLAVSGYALLAAHQRDKLQDERQRTEAVLDALTRLLASADPYALEAGTLSVADLVRQTADDLLQRPQGDAAVQALLMERLAAISASARDFRREAELLAAAHALALAHGLPAEVAARLQLGLAKSQASSGQHELAGRTLQQAWSTLAVADLPSARLLQAQLLREGGDEAGGAAALRALLADMPNEAALAAVRGNAHNSLALAYGAMGQQDQAIEQYRLALATAPRELPGDQDLLAIIRGNMAVALARQHRYAEAEGVFQELLNWRIETLGADHPAVATAASVYSPLLLRTHRFASAWSLLIRHRAAAEQPGAAARRSDYLYNLGRSGLYAGHHWEAIDALLEAAERTQPAAGQTPSGRHRQVLSTLAFSLFEVGAERAALSLAQWLLDNDPRAAGEMRLVLLLSDSANLDPTRRAVLREGLLKDSCLGPELVVLEALRATQPLPALELPPSCEGPVSARWLALGLSWTPQWDLPEAFQHHPEPYRSPLIERLRTGTIDPLPASRWERVQTLLSSLTQSSQLKE